MFHSIKIIEWNIFKQLFFIMNTIICNEFVDRIYSMELVIKDTTDIARSASYLDLHLDPDSEDRLRTTLYDKGDYINFPIVRKV